jgi:hypothetical protein
MLRFAGRLKFFGFALIMLPSLPRSIYGVEEITVQSTGSVTANGGKQNYSLTLGNLEVNNLLRPGDRIDVLKNSSQGDQKMSTTVLHDIEVLHVAPQGPTIALAVTADEAKELDLLQKENNFSIALPADVK